MSDEGRKGLTAEDVLAPKNFLGYIGAAAAVLRSAGRRALIPFALVGLVVAVALSFAIGLIDTDESQLEVAMLYLQLLMLPLVSSLLVPRISRVMAFALVDNEISFRQAGRALRGTWPHIFAGGMIAALLTLLVTQVMGVLGALIAWHVAMGPPVFAHVIGLERESMQGAFARARRLAKGSALRIFAYMVSAALAFVMVEFIVSSLIASALTTAVDAGVAQAIFVPISGVVSGVGLSFMCALGLVAYFDLRARSEDFDIDELRQMSLAEPDDPKPETA